MYRPLLVVSSQVQFQLRPSTLNQKSKSVNNAQNSQAFLYVILVNDCNSDLTSRMSRSVPLRPFETVSGLKTSRIFLLTQGG